MTDALPTGRLHPWSWVFHAVRALREVALPLIVFLVLRRDDDFGPLFSGLAAAVALIVYGIVRSRTFRYQLLDRELLVREGLFVRETRHVPFTRIQAVNERQGPLHRLLGVTELVLESGSAGKPEAVMRVLDTAEAAHIAALLRAAGAPAGDAAAGATGTPAAEAAPMRELLRVPTDELILLGIISNRGMVVVALLAGLIAQNRELLDSLPLDGLLDRIDLDRALGDSAATAVGTGLGALLWAVVVLCVGLLVIVRLLSIVYALFTLHGFTLRRTGDRLRVNRGLLVRIDVSGRVSGFQRIVLEQSLLHRAFRRCALRVDLAGASWASDHPDAGDTRLDTLAPIATPAGAQALLRELVPGVDLDALDWRPLHRSAARRRWQRLLWAWSPALAALVAAACWVPGLPPTAPAAALAVVVVVVAVSGWVAHRWARWSAFAVGDGVVAWRSGAWARRWTLVFRERAQCTLLGRTPRDRREGTVSLSVDMQSMTLGRALHIPYLDAADGARLNADFWPGRTPARAGLG